jgi:hypothetical protein
MSKTLFEKIFMGIICIIQVINVSRMILENKNIKRNCIIKNEYNKQKE